MKTLKASEIIKALKVKRCTFKVEDVKQEIEFLHGRQHIIDQFLIDLQKYDDNVIKNSRLYKLNGGTYCELLCIMEDEKQQNILIENRR